MENIMLYLMRVSVYLLVFTAGYYLLLSRDGQPAVNRIYILGSFMISLLLGAFPRVVFPAAGTGAEQMILLPELIIQAGEATRHSSEVVAGNLLSLAMVPRVIAFISLIVLLHTAANLMRIFWLRRYNPRIDKEGLQIVLMSSPISPFSFFRYVFVPGNILEREHFDKVLAHEKAHWLRGHSWDVIFMQLMRIIFWFHPAWYFLSRELKAQHEYEADHIACLGLKKSEYQLTLLEYTLSGTLIPLSNPFNVSLIKKRIMMMNKSHRKPALQLWLKTLILLPFLAMAVMIQSCQNQLIEEGVPPQEENKIYTAVDVPPVFPGGNDQIRTFLMNNIRYPKAARDARHQGGVYVAFVVDREGKAKDARVLRGVSPELDEEALRMVEIMPRWTPAILDGKAVDVHFTIPIFFRLSEDANHAMIFFD